MKIKIDINIKINRIVKFLVLADLIFLGGWSMIQPIFSVFVIKNIPGASLVILGVVMALYWLVKSLLQIPVANYLDNHDGEKDDFYALLISLTLAAVSAFMLAITTSLWQLFFAQFIYAVAMGFYVPSWSGIFSRHLDDKRFSFDWSLDSTAVGLTSFVAALLSGILAEHFGFSFVFFTVGILSLISAVMLFLVPDLIIPKEKKEEAPVIRDHSVAGINR
jgi:MFS family permease